MIHVVDFEKTAFSSPIQGVLPQCGQRIIAESGRGPPTFWHSGNLVGPFSTPPRPTLHAPRRDQRGQVVRGPAPLATTIHLWGDTKTDPLDDTKTDPLLDTC